MRGDVFDAVLQVYPLVRRCMLRDAHARPPFPRGPDRSRRKAAAAIRADVEQFRLDALRAERAFIGADPRIPCIRWQVTVAIFAVRSELQRHGETLAWGECIIADRVYGANATFPSISVSLDL